MYTENSFDSIFYSEAFRYYIDAWNETHLIFDKELEVTADKKTALN